MHNATSNQGADAAYSKMKLSAAWVAFPVAAVIVLVAVAWWLIHPSYVVLIRGIQGNDATLVTTELQNNRIKYQYDPDSGEVLVPANEIQHANITLSGKGLIYSADFENARASATEHLSINENYSGSNSQRRSLEIQLAQTIASIDDVQSARVHIALSNVDKSGGGEKPRASVVVRLYPGRQLKSGQINAISHLIASSTAGLSLQEITIVDQSGQLLKSAGNPVTGTLDVNQFEYRQRLEQMYVERIENILKPILGEAAMRSQVTADIAFADPSLDADSKNIQPVNATLRHLSATVIVDDSQLTASDGSVRKISRNNRELQRITALVKEAVGFNEKRGDSVNVINEPFKVTRHLTVPQENTPRRYLAGFLQNESYIVASVAIALIAIIAFMMKRLMRRQIRVSSVTPEDKDGEPMDTENSLTMTSAGNNSSPGKGSQTAYMEEKTPFEQCVLKAKQMVQDDPKLVAQVLKQWVREG